MAGDFEVLFGDADGERIVQSITCGRLGGLDWYDRGTLVFAPDLNATSPQNYFRKHDERDPLVDACHRCAGNSYNGQEGKQDGPYTSDG